MLENLQFGIRQLFQRFPAELETYYAAHKERYKQEASRDIEYVLFPVVASKGDEDKVIKWINDIKPEFAAVEDPAAYVNINSDKQFDPSFFKNPIFLPISLNLHSLVRQEISMAHTKRAKSWKLCKIQNSKNCRILSMPVIFSSELPPRREAVKAKSTADSLKRVLTLGGDFAALARRYSGDEGSAVKGGELGWFKRGMMVKPFRRCRILRESK